MTLLAYLLCLGVIADVGIEGKVHMKPEHSYVHFEYAGSVRGVSVSTGITITLELKPYFQSLHMVAGHLRHAIDNSSPFLDAKTKKKHHAVLESGLDNCIHEARTLTHTVTTWMEEEELMKHPLLASYDQVYSKGVKSMAAPLDHSSSSYVHVDHWEDDYEFEETPVKHGPKTPGYVLPPILDEDNWLRDEESTTVNPDDFKDDVELYEDF